MTEAFRLANLVAQRVTVMVVEWTFILKDYGKYTDQKPSSNAEESQAIATGFFNKGQDNMP